MLLTKSRIPILAIGIILLFGFVLFLMAERASADVAADPFTNTATDLSWSAVWDDPTDTVTVCFTLGSGWVDGKLGEVHDIEIFVDPADTGPFDLIAEGPVGGPGGDGHYAVNTYYCAGEDGAGGARPLVVPGITEQPTLVGIHLVGSDATHTTHTDIATADTQVAADPVAGTGPSIADVGWDWTFDTKRGLQVCINRGASWTGIADDIKIWVDGVSKGSIAVPAENAISCSLITPIGAGVTAPTSVALSILDAADNTIGVSPAPTSPELLIPNDLGWEFTSSGTSLQVKVKIGSELSPATHFIEVYPNPSIAGQPNSPALTQSLPGGGALPTNLILDLDLITLTDPLDLDKPVKVLFLDASGNLITFNRGSGIHTEKLEPPEVIAPPPEPTPTPVQTTDTPASQVTSPPAHTGAATAIIQPSAAATVSSTDGSVVVAVPALVKATTFTLEHNPTPASVPAPPARMNVVRAFELNAYDIGGIQIASLSLLRTVTITVAYTPADIAVAPQKNPANLKIARYDTANKVWIPMNTTLDLAAQTLSAKVSNFSLFGVVGVTPPSQVVATSTPKAPPTGDFAPGSGLVLALTLAGFLLITAGGAYLTQSRRLRD